MNWNERKIYVQQLVHYTPIKQRKSDATSRRSGTFVYSLKKYNGSEIYRVCKNMFLNTLSVGEWSVPDWVTNGRNREIVEVN